MPAQPQLEVKVLVNFKVTPKICTLVPFLTIFVCRNKLLTIAQNKNK